MRGLLRFLGAPLVTLLAAPPVMLAWVIGLVHRRLGRRLRARVTHHWARMMAFSLGLRVSRTGDLPGGAALLCPNHVSYLDILALGTLGPVAFVSRADVSGWPLLGPLARIAGTIFLERERRRDTQRAAGDVERALEHGVNVVVFLEGRAGPGDELRPFRSSLVEAAVVTDSPAVPLRLRYALPDSPGVPIAGNVSWHDGTPFPSHVYRLSRLGRVTCEIAVLPARRGEDRKALAAELEEDVRAAL